MAFAMKKIMSLDIDEIILVFTMMRKYGGMDHPTNEKYNKHKKTKKTPYIKTDFSLPNLYDLDDPLWETCTNEAFITYYQILKKCSI